MPKLLEKDALLTDLTAVNEILETISADDDPIGKLAYEQRKHDLEEQLSRLEATRDTLGSIALLFSGDPVFGSRAIDASFASQALGRYQDVVAKLYATRLEERGLSDRGPVPYRDLSALQITDVVHGSFGFILTERDTDQPGLLPSQVQDTLAQAGDLIASFCAEGDEEYVRVIESINRRVFTAVKEFFAVLQEANAEVRMVEGEREDMMDRQRISRGFERSQRTQIDELEETLAGVLIGILPTSMQFEFQPDGRETISGKTGPAISQGYLQRIHAQEQTAGSHCTAKILTKTTVRPTGQVTKKYTMLDLSIP